MDSMEQETARDLLDFIDASPSPWHAVDEAATRLAARGFTELHEDEPWTLTPGAGYFVRRDGASLVAFRLGERDPAAGGYRMVAAHTDSPGFRIKPSAGQTREGMAALGVAIYGGPILASFTDRDLTLAGRIWVRDDTAPEGARPEHVRFDEPLLRLPNLAIHMNREVNKEGLKLDYQEQLPLVLAAADEALPPEERFRGLLAERAGADPEALLAWSLAVADTQPGVFWGADGDLIADGQLDDLACCHAALQALPDAPPAEGVAMAALFDHEEVGSESQRGAAGSFLEATLERTGAALGLDGEGQRRALARSWLVSADMAHAHHPNFASYHDAQHPVRINGGPVLKINAAQRYATDDRGEAFFARLCEDAGVPMQRYIHRNDLPCGATIGPILAARLGVRTVDVGSAMWAMHSARESAGARDPAMLIRALAGFYAG